MKKIKLKRNIKRMLLVILAIILMAIPTILLLLTIRRINTIAEECDKEKGYTCSYYEIRQYSYKKNNK